LNLRRPLLVVLVLAALLAGTRVRAAGAFVDVLDQPAQASPLASKAMLQSVAKAGRRLVAAGQRGHIIVSDDAGGSWKQSPVPVSSDLTAVFFADARNGWAVGHDGVILASNDGGDSWRVQLTGIKAADLMVAALAGTPLAEEAKRFRDQGADKPFLDVWFADANNGYAVGAYNLIFHTTDGGNTWEPWFDRTDNPKLYNLYAIRPAGGALYIAGEAGLALKLDASSQRFRAVATPYNGSWFGIADAGSAVIVFGLRGNAYSSADGGASWTKVDAPLQASIVASANSAGGRLLLADAGGRVAASNDGGRTFTHVTMQPSLPIFGFTDLGNGLLAVVGPRGASVQRMLQR
jgi:photosystem II stability/assembly factor-like uncharacterized protein